RLSGVKRNRALVWLIGNWKNFASYLRILCHGPISSYLIRFFSPGSLGSVASQSANRFALQVKVGFGAYVKTNAENRATGKGARPLVFLAHFVGTIEADAKAVPAKREVPDLRSHGSLGHGLVIDIELGLAQRLAVFTRLFADEFHAEGVLARRQLPGNELLFRLDAEKVVHVVKFLVLDEERMPAETLT